MFICGTSGNGMYSKRITEVKVLDISVPYFDEETGYALLNVTFDENTWDVNEDGLVYTDPGWLVAFRQKLVERYGFTEEEVQGIGYSEAGMQGQNYVSLETGGEFGLALKRIAAHNEEVRGFFKERDVVVVDAQEQKLRELEKFLDANREFAVGDVQNAIMEQVRELMRK